MDSANEKFKDFLLFDHLSDLVGIKAKKMFGSYGLYVGEKMCGIIHKEVLYLKTNEETRTKFIAPECKPFTYLKPKENKVATLKNYIAIPSRLLDDAEELKSFILQSCRLK